MHICSSFTYHNRCFLTVLEYDKLLLLLTFSNRSFQTSEQLLTLTCIFVCDHKIMILTAAQQLGNDCWSTLYLYMYCNQIFTHSLYLTTETETYLKKYIHVFKMRTTLSVIQLQYNKMNAHQNGSWTQLKWIQWTLAVCLSIRILWSTVLKALTLKA